MADPRITWDSGTHTLDLEGLSLYEPSPQEARRSRVFADSGVSETSIIETFDRLVFGIENFDSQTIFDGLYKWWAWAKQGKSYTFAFDSADVVDTALSSGISAGATSMTLDSVTGVTAGSRYKLIETDGLETEIITVASGWGGSNPVTLDTGTAYAYNAAAVFRSVDYFPALESEDSVFPVTENPGNTWTLRHRAREYKSP